MDEAVHEEYWAIAVDAEAHGEAEPSFYFDLPLIGLSEEQTRRVREQAEEVLGRYAASQRALIIQTFRSIARATTIRIEAGPGRAPANVYLIRVATDPTDPIDQVRDDRGHVLSWARRWSEDPDPAVAEVWRRVTSSFDKLHFEKPD